jgi:hypothetical protein
MYLIGSDESDDAKDVSMGHGGLQLFREIVIRATLLYLSHQKQLQLDSRESAQSVEPSLKKRKTESSEENFTDFDELLDVIGEWVKDTTPNNCTGTTRNFFSMVTGGGGFDPATFMQRIENAMAISYKKIPKSQGDLCEDFFSMGFIGLYKLTTCSDCGWYFSHGDCLDIYDSLHKIHEFVQKTNNWEDNKELYQDLQNLFLVAATSQKCGISLCG